MIWNKKYNEMLSILERFFDYFLCIEGKINHIVKQQEEDRCSLQTLEETLRTKEGISTIDRLESKIIHIIHALENDDVAKHDIELATKTIDKFEDYMKNVDKLNAMINDFKGCVSLAKAAIEERKSLIEEEAKSAVLKKFEYEIYKAKIDFIHESIIKLLPMVKKKKRGRKKKKETTD